MVIPYYSSIHTNKYYEIEGRINLRTSNIFNGDSFYITDPFSSSSTRRFVIKKNTSTVEGWTELTGTYQSSGLYQFLMPTNYKKDLSITMNEEFVWRYTSFNAPN